MSETEPQPEAAPSLVCRREVMIEWGDCDPAGIVYYPRYLAYFDNSTNALFALAGMPKHEMIRTYDLVGIPLVDTQAKFSSPSKWGDTVVVETRIVEWRRSSFIVEHTLTNGGRVCVQGRDTRVWTGRDPDDPSRIRSRPIPDEVVARFR